MSGNKPFLVKGIQSVDDAKKAVELGVDGIVCKCKTPRCTSYRFDRDILRSFR